MFLKLLGDIDKVPPRIFKLCPALNLEVQEVFSSNFCRRRIASKFLVNEDLLISGEHLRLELKLKETDNTKNLVTNKKSILKEKNDVSCIPIFTKLNT